MATRFREFKSSNLQGNHTLSTSFRVVTWEILDGIGDTWGYLGSIKGSPLRVTRSQNLRGDPGGAKVASALIPQMRKGRLLVDLGFLGPVPR